MCAWEISLIFYYRKKINMEINLISEILFYFIFTGPKNAVLRLAVKFFPPDPGQLQEEYTR